jgi:hypothetical protein
MHQIKNIIPILALLLMYACIKPYNPLIESNAANKLVVSGRITDIEGWQEVYISTSSPVENPEYIPVPGCIVNIIDNNGNVFPFPEDNPGRYRAWLAIEYLIPGTSYKVTVQTPEGETIESSYDTLMPGAKLDSIYYVIEDVPAAGPDGYLRGIQFYVDLDATEFECRNYRWEIAQTWEFHAARPAEYYYDGKFHEIIPPDYSKMVCWSNATVKNIYTLSTKNLSQNVFQKYKLHFVDGHTSSRLGILYSILVRQQSLSENAFNFWEQVRINSNELGGLYEKQPLAIKGNLLNLTNPEKEVLGYFYATSESSKRYFYQDIEGLELDFSDNCYEGPLPLTGWAGFKKWDYPVYYYYTDDGALLILTDQCVDCRKMGGTITKPDFWPQ